MGPGPVGQAMIFVMLLAASIIVGTCVLAYAARCVLELSKHMVVDTIGVEIHPMCQEATNEQVKKC
jgi:hypothetical protein